MSGKPYPEGATRVIEIVGKLASLEAEAKALTTAIHDAEAKLGPVQRERAELTREFGRLIESMDLHSSGNAGYAGRMAWFLGEVHRQAQRAAFKPCGDCLACKTSDGAACERATRGT